MPEMLCSLCSEVFSTADLLQSHVAVSHLRWTPVECGYCPTYYGTVAEARGHLSRCHTLQPPRFVCQPNDALAARLAQIVDQSRQSSRTEPSSEVSDQGDVSAPRQASAVQAEVQVEASQQRHQTPSFEDYCLSLVANNRTPDQLPTAAGFNDTTASATETSEADETLPISVNDSRTAPPTSRKRKRSSSVEILPIADKQFEAADISDEIMREQYIELRRISGEIAVTASSDATVRQRRFLAMAAALRPTFDGITNDEVVVQRVIRAISTASRLRDPLAAAKTMAWHLTLQLVPQQQMFDDYDEGRKLTTDTKRVTNLFGLEFIQRQKQPYRAILLLCVVYYKFDAIDAVEALDNAKKLVGHLKQSLTNARCRKRNSSQPQQQRLPNPKMETSVKSEKTAEEIQLDPQ